MQPPQQPMLMWHHREWRCDRAGEQLRLMYQGATYSTETIGDVVRGTARSLEWLSAVRALDDPTTVQLLRQEAAALQAMARIDEMVEQTEAGSEVSIRTWTQRHGNGWVASVCDAPDGRYAAWAARADDLPRVDQLADSLAEAQGAALMSLRMRSRHFDCALQCACDWTETATSIAARPTRRTSF